MKKKIQFTVLIFFIFTAISYSQNINFTKSHDVFNDTHPNLIVPPYVYYPPAADNPLTFTNTDISSNSAPQN